MASREERRNARRAHSWNIQIRKVIPGHFGAYRGSNVRKTPAYRAALKDALGTMWLELAVGQSCSLDGEPFELPAAAQTK